MAQQQEFTGRVLLTLLLTCKYVSSSHKNEIPCKPPETACFNATESFEVSIGGTGVLSYHFYMTAPKPSPNISRNTNFILRFIFFSCEKLLSTHRAGSVACTEQTTLDLWVKDNRLFPSCVCCAHCLFHSWDSH